MNQFNYQMAEFEGTIIVVENDSQINEAIEYLSSHTVLGFDTETKPSFQKGQQFGVAILQLATNDRAYIFRLKNLSDYHKLFEIFKNPLIIKVGVAIRDDIKALQKLLPFEPQGFVELSELAKKCLLKNMGLKGMCEEVLNVTISKKAKLSNWEISKLSQSQILYAATDAWIGKMIYDELNSR